MIDFYLAAMLFAPLIAASLNTLFLLNNKQTPQIVFTLFALSSVTISALFALLLLYYNLSGEIAYVTLFTFLHVGTFSIDFTLNGDNLALQMSLVISGVGMLIHYYAHSYMKEEPGYARFFIFFNLFMFFMLLLVLAANPFLLYIGWEGVGLCSFALIGYYLQKRENIFAANKAFIANRIGDFALLCALLLLYSAMPNEPFTFHTTIAHLQQLNETQRTVIALLLFIAMTGKSAQVPLYVWLPDAMAGPTPVSALIHAATMVTAGVYLLARLFELFILVPEVLHLIGYVAAFSALLAAVIALRQNDIKKILAYSTMSQLGYMFMALSAQMPSYAMFHLYAHAFFKALLFMGAGAIILHAHHEQNIHKLSTTRQSMPLMYALMLIATASISGLFPFSGFFSKDAIMLALFASGEYLLFTLALLTALLTSLYMFRLFFTLFHQHKPQLQSIAPLPRSIYWPMIVLAIFTLLNGLFNLPHIFGGHETFSSWLLFNEPRTFSMQLALSTEVLLLCINVAVALFGIWLAYQWYVKRIALALPQWLIKSIEQKFYVDELYINVIVNPLYTISRWVDKQINTNLIDSSINGSAFLYAQIGAYFRLLLNGSARLYLMVISTTASLMFIYLISVLERL